MLDQYPATASRIDGNRNGAINPMAAPATRRGETDPSLGAIAQSTAQTMA